MTVYFADKALVFAAEAPAAGCVVTGGASRDKILKILESTNCAEFTQVEAAGGVVVDDRGEALLMRRNGRWDLPKGHIEPGESPEVCAAREIAEETGIRAEVVRPLCDTWHAYWFPKTARWELKRTHWFLLRGGEGVPTPQTEEGVEEVVWCSPARAAEYAAQAFPTVRRVFACLNGGR